MPLDRIQGIVERTTFYSQETGYSVLRLKVKGMRDLVTAVGNLPEVNPGESLRLEGVWATHGKYGRQFRVERCEQILPATTEGIKRYLGSGLVKGVGPVTAGRIVQRFGADTLTVLDEAPQRLREALGVGAKRAAAISAAWEEQKNIREVMIFLQSHSVTTGLAVKIYKTYGEDSLKIVQQDPYRLARDIWGVGFKTADKIAQDLGLPLDAPSRVQAGVAYTLSQLADEGHVYVPQEHLVREGQDLLGVSAEQIETGIASLDLGDVVRREHLRYPHGSLSSRSDGAMGVREQEAVYLAPFYYGEVGVTHRLKGLIENPTTRLLPFRTIDWDAFLAQVSSGSDIVLSDEQEHAVRAALTHKVTILTGGPGTGKTVTVRTVIAALEAFRCSYALCAPTGRAAKRLSEATGRPAKTIHRLLEYSPLEGFRRNEANPLDADCVIVDEASMIDLLLANNLLKAVDEAAHVLFVGDIDQLPSVGAGNVLRDIIASGRADVVRLMQIFRQAADSGIVVNAHRINRGQQPKLNEYGDFFFFAKADPDEAAELLVDIVGRRIPAKFGFDPIEDVQVLAPMHRGACGVTNLNTLLQDALNPAANGKVERRLRGRIFRVGDKVMQIRNDYDREVYNGDIGTVTAIDQVAQTVTVSIDERPICYDWTEVDELSHAFAISVHKSQGSEYPVVVIPMLTQHYMMLRRNLLYTAISRAKRVVVLVGTRRAIAIAMHNNRVRERYSALSLRLEQA